MTEQELIAARARMDQQIAEGNMMVDAVLEFLENLKSSKPDVKRSTWLAALAVYADSLTGEKSNLTHKELTLLFTMLLDRISKSDLVRR